jgi:hypothetical protein
MKTIMKVFAVIALIAATFSYSSNASAGGGGGSPSRYKGLGASAFFSSVDESGCIFTQTSVFANEQTVRSQPGPSSPMSFVSVFISMYDSCTGTQLFSADGWALLAAPDLEVSRQLDSATLNATITMFEYVSGGTFDVYVNLAWAGVSPIGHEMSQFHYRFDGCQQKSQNNGTFRLAQVSGSVSDGGTEYASAQFTDARIFSSKGGTIIHGCGF